MAARPPAIQLSTSDRDAIDRWLAAHGTPQPVASRIRIVLATAAGRSDGVVAREREMNRKTVRLWRARFAQAGGDSLWEVAPGRGGKPTFGPGQIPASVKATLQTKPTGRTQGSCRLMAENQKVSKSPVRHLWRSHNLKPHRVTSFTLSREARVLEQLTDVVGLYLNPPQQALGLGVDEQRQIQALERTPPGLPPQKGRCGTRTHDDKRNGTTPLFATLEILQGQVVGQGYKRPRPQEVLRFLRRRDEAFPGPTPLPLGMDNDGTQQHPKVPAWLKGHPRFLPHFVPTRSSWLTLGERGFGELTSKRVRRGSFSSVEALQKAMGEFLEAWNENPKPFVWTATVESIQRQRARCRQTLEQIQPGGTHPRKRKSKKPLSS